MTIEDHSEDLARRPIAPHSDNKVECCDHPL
jgi:hypothetical protein